MLVSAYIQESQQRIPVTVNAVEEHKCELIHFPLPHRFVLVLTFSKPIIQLRNHDYRWVSTNDDLLIPEYANKILQLADGTYVQGSITQGIWEYQKKSPNTLFWHFHPADAEALTVYKGENNLKTRVGAQSVSLTHLPTLLFSKSGALELSRTPIPFVGIVCFTDHCDYDTEQNLETQRVFLKEVGIKVTKGFFLHHFSKRATNASWEHQAQELKLWQTDGHELAYHSLSQSIKSARESASDFSAFQPPFSPLPVWIDHGFQPYNWSTYQNNEYANTAFESVMERHGITTFWNYMDTGRVSNGVVNMLNVNQFTLVAFHKSIRHLPWLKRIENRVKNIIFYADNSAQRIDHYMRALARIREFLHSKHPKELIAFIRHFFPVIFKVAQFELGIGIKKNQPYPLARFGPVFFKHQQGNIRYTVFQSVELVDFSQGLTPESIDLLRQEAGVLIAHTYFAVDMEHHTGRLLVNEITIASLPNQNLRYLGQCINQQQLWNPTLSELVEAWNMFNSVTLEIDALGVIAVQSGFTLPVRRIQ